MKVLAGLLIVLFLANAGSINAYNFEEENGNGRKKRDRRIIEVLRPTQTPTNIPSPTPSPTLTATPTRLPTSTPTHTPTPTMTPTPTPIDFSGITTEEVQIIKTFSLKDIFVETVVRFIFPQYTYLVSLFKTSIG